jgi:hypothetical protein
VKPQQRDRTKHNIKLIIIMTFVKWFWQVYSAMDLVMLIINNVCCLKMAF